MLAAAIATTSCSMARLGYDVLPTWTHWQVERYLDLDEAQRDIVGRHVDDLHRWHRRTQLPDYASFLREADDRLRGEIGADDFGRWRDRAMQAWEPIAERLAPGVAELGLTLREEQIRRMRERFVESNEKQREQMLPARGETREQARAERLVKRAEFFLGRLTPAQVREITALAAALPPNEEAWLAEREARQRGFVRLLERLRKEQPPRAEARRMAREYLLTMWHSHEVRRGHRIERSIEAGDAFAIRVLAMANAKQREHLSKLLTGFASDFDKLSRRGGDAPHAGDDGAARTVAQR